MRSRKTTLQHEGGYALLSVLAITTALMVSALAAIQLSRSELHFTADHVSHQQAFYVADAGVQAALAQLSNDRVTAGTSMSYTYTGTASIGGGSYAITIAQDPLFSSDVARKQIQSTGTRNGQQSTIVAHAVVQPALVTTVIVPPPGGGTLPGGTTLPPGSVIIE